MRFLILAFLTLSSTISHSETNNCEYSGKLKVANKNIELVRLAKTNNQHNFEGGTPDQTTIVSGLYQIVRVKNTDGKFVWFSFRCADQKNNYNPANCTKAATYSSTANFKTSKIDDLNASTNARIDDISNITFELRQNIESTPPFHIQVTQYNITVKKGSTVVGACKTNDKSAQPAEAMPDNVKKSLHNR